MRQAKIATAALAAALIMAGAASAQQQQIGDLLIGITARVTPTELPARGSAPVKILDSTRISTESGDIPAQLQHIILKFDRHGRLDTRGLATCTVARLAGTTPAQARRRCHGSIVGKGKGSAAVAIPGRPPATISSALTLFNGPRNHGANTVIAHGYETIPTPAAVIVPIEIERLHRGAFGFKVTVDLPPIAGGAGSVLLAKLTIGRTWMLHGKRHSYVSAACVGGQLRTHGSFFFSGGTFFPGTIIQTCGRLGK
jgi:hypothetical protein